MIKFITIILAFFFGAIAYSQKTYRCFDCDDNAKLKISVEYNKFEKPISVKYRGQKASIGLVPIKGSTKYNQANSTEAFNEILDGQIIGKYVFTHSGNWDYIVYIRKDGKKFKFTINLDESLNQNNDGYRETPCY
jgi:hypothetical protein